MKFNFDNYHHRQSIRLKGYDYSQNGAYFITVCVQNKECIFGKIENEKIILNQYGEIAKKYWLEISNHFPNVILDEFVIMPNHIHGIIIIDASVGVIHELPLQKMQIIRRKMLLPKIIGFFKMNVAKLINIKLNRQGQSIWQRNYYDHIIRDEKSLNEIREYIVNNFLKWELDRNNPKNL
ncbi:MAG: transposase [Candidatus Kuenenbacteria bacterium]